jgi:hypothetical protein
MSQKRYYFYVGLIIGLILGMGLPFLFLKPNTRESDYTDFQNYVAYEAESKLNEIEFLKNGKFDWVLHRIQFNLLMDWSRIILAKRNLVDNRYSDDVYIHLLQHYSQHPEEWNWLPDKEMTMLPGDPTLPVKINVRRLIESELAVPYTDAGDITKNPEYFKTTETFVNNVIQGISENGSSSTGQLNNSGNQGKH